MERNFYDSCPHQHHHHHPQENALTNNNEEDAMTKQNIRPRRENMSFVNQGLDYNAEHGYEMPLRSPTSFLCEPHSGRLRENQLYESADDDRSPAAKDFIIKQGIRQLAASGTTNGDEENSEIKKGASIRCHSCLSRCTWFLQVSALILVVASGLLSAFVYHQYNNLRKHRSCTPATKMAPIEELKGANPEVADLMKRMEDLETKFQQLELDNSRPSNVRQTKKTLSKLRRDVEHVEIKVQTMENDVFSKIVTMKTQLNNSINHMNRKMVNVSRKVDQKIPSMKNCNFKVQNTSTTGDRNNRKATATERSDDNVKLLGVTCCTKYSPKLRSGSPFITAERKNSLLTYTCHCFNDTDCDICYWECQGS